MKKPQPLRSILEKTLKRLEIDLPLKGYSVFRAWREIVGETVASQTHPRSIRNRILFIDVSHSTWVQQLQFLKPTLLEKLNAFLGEALIQDIRFRVGKIDRVLPPPEQTESWSDQDLAFETRMRIEKLLQNVEDEEVRKNLGDLMIKGAKLERFRKKSTPGG